MFKFKNQKLIPVAVLMFFIVAFYFPNQAKATLDPNTTLAPAPAVTLSSGQTLPATDNVLGVTTPSPLSGNQPILLKAGTGVSTDLNGNSTTNTNFLTNGTVKSSSSSCTPPKDIAALFDYARCVISNSIIPFIIGLGVLIFLIGVVQYVASGDNEEKREASRNMMIYGIIAIFVMVSVWGFVNILVKSFNLTNTAPQSATINPS